MYRAFLLLSPFLAAATLLTGCPYGDVGAPCSHGKIEPLPTRRITFPALSCNDLLCVYAEERDVPEDPCDSDADCNKGGVTGNVCDGADEGKSGTCKIGIQHVLEYSMCSKKCASEDDCKNTGLSTKKRPVAKENACEAGFACTRIQKLGEFCCEPMCVCKDYLANNDTDVECQNGDVDCDGGNDNDGTPEQDDDDDDDDDTGEDDE